MSYTGSGANATPMGKLHPILAAKHGAPPPPWPPQQGSNGSTFDQGLRNLPVKREALQEGRWGNHKITSYVYINIGKESK